MGGGPSSVPAIRSAEPGVASSIRVASTSSMAVVLLLLIQVSALAAVLASGAELSGLLVPAMTGRLAVTWACRRGVPAARPEGLGALVAGSIGQFQLIVATGATLLVATAVGLFGAITLVPAASAALAR